TTANDQTNSSIAMDANGDYTIVWTSTNQDGSGTGVYGQRYGGGNDAPVNNLPASQITNEDTNIVFNVANGNAISITDVDAASGSLHVTLTATNGLLTLTATTALTFTTGDGTADATMTFTGTIANI